MLPKPLAYDHNKLNTKQPDLWQKTYITNFISEDQIEKAVIDVFINQLGYRHLNCFLEDITGRSMESEVVISSLLRQQLEKLNQQAPAHAIDFAVEQLTKTRADL